MFPKFTILSKQDAGTVFNSNKGSNMIKAAVSIGDKGEDFPHALESVPHVLRLEFEDTYNRFDEDCPKKEDIEKLIIFCYDIKKLKQPGTVVFHCYAGISRSSASAYIANFIWGRTASEALDAVYAEKADTCPNPLIVKLADNILESSALTDVLRKRPCGPDFQFPNLMGINEVWK